MKRQSEVSRSADVERRATPQADTKQMHPAGILGHPNAILARRNSQAATLAMTEELPRRRRYT